MEEVPDLPIKTKLEMARGAMGKSVSEEEDALAWIARLNYLHKGESVLRLIAQKANKTVMIYDRKETIVVKLFGPLRGDVFEFDVPDNGDFPSDTLQAQIILLCG